MKTLTVGAMSKPSSERPARAAPSSSSGRNSATCSGENSVGIQPSAISPASARVLRPDRRQVDRDRAPAPARSSASAPCPGRRAAAARASRRGTRAARAPAPCARPRRTRACAGAAWRSAAPCQPSATCGPDEPMPEQHAPVGELVERRGGHRRHRRRAAGHLEDRRAELDLRRLPGEPAEDRRGVRAVGLRGPDASRSRAARPPGRSRAGPRAVRPRPQ